MAAVAVGGSIGATGRWAIRSTYDVVPGDWPWPTLVVNIIGCLLIGVASRRLERGSLRWNAIITGLHGGFTTMSSFAVELNDMVDLDRTGSAVAYGAVTLGAGAAAVTLGLATSPGATTSPEQRPS
jgi:CrcB protein